MVNPIHVVEILLYSVVKWSYAVVFLLYVVVSVLICCAFLVHLYVGIGFDIGIDGGGGGGVKRNVKVLRQSFYDLIFSKSSDEFTLYLV